MGAHSRLVKPYEPSPKKRFGQHFLRDTGVIDRIARWIQPGPNDFLLDIGAGYGALSARLAPECAHLIAVEIDADCIPRLESALALLKSTTVVSADVLQLDLMELVSHHMQSGQRLRIVGNLPYNIATAIIAKFLHITLPINEMFFMVQYEVAQRITAKPGSRQYGFLSVHCQHHSDVQLGFKVAPACFVPRPQVSSAMVSLRPKPTPHDPAFELDFEALAKAAFSYRRKTLTNALSKHPLFGPITAELLRQTSIDGSRRAEELSVQEYERLALVYHQMENDELRMTNDE